MKRRLAGLVLACAFGGSAQAVTLTSSYNFTGHFTQSGAPYTDIAGSLSLAYDPVNDIATLTALDLTIGGVHFDPTNSSANSLSVADISVGGNLNGPGGVTARTNDFFVRFNYYNPSSGYSVGYTTSSFGAVVIGNGTITPQVASVPEPATWATVIVGVGAVGGALRRRSRRTLAIA